MSTPAASRQGTATDDKQLRAELGTCAVALPAHRGLRVPFELSHRRAGRARRVSRVALRSALRLAERLRRAARSPGRLFPAGAVRRQRPNGSGVRARYKRAVHDVEHAGRVGAGPRCADHGSATRRGRGHAVHATAGRRRQRPFARAHGCLRYGQRRRGDGVRASVRLRARRGGVVADRRERHTADASGAGQTIRLQTDMAIGVEGGRVRARHTLEPGEQVYCSLSWAEGLASPQSIDEADALLARHDKLLARLAGRVGPSTTAGGSTSSVPR